MADWGLYSALRGTDDWKTKRADAMMNLKIAETRKQNAEAETARSMELEEYMNKYTNEMQNLDVLKEDQARVQGVEKDSRQEIIKGLAKHNGDLKKFMSSGGISAMNRYKQSVLQSKEYQNAIANKQASAQWMQDRAQNKYIKKSMIDVPGVDENGNQITTQKMVSMEDQMRLFQEGKINQINYGGSEKKVDLKINDFSRLIKDPNNPYSQDNIVSQSNIYDKMISGGASDEQAMDIANKYGEMIKNGGDTWKWNAPDRAGMKLKYDTLNAGIDKYNTGVKNSYEMKQKQAAAAKNAKRSNQVANIFLPKIEAMTEGKSQFMNSTERKFFKDQYNIKSLTPKESNFGGKEAYSGKAFMFSPSKDGGFSGGSKEIDLSNAEIESFGFGKSGYVKHEGKNYIPVKMIVRADQMESHIDNEAGSFWRNAFNQNEIEGVDGEDGYLVDTYLPIDHMIEDETTLSQLNKAYGVKTGGHELEPAHYGRDYQVQRLAQMQESLIQAGYSPEEVRSMLVQNSGLYHDKFDTEFKETEQ